MVVTCPHLPNLPRDYWLGDRYAYYAQDIEELDSIDDLMELHVDLVNLELTKEAMRFASDDDSTVSADLYDSDSTRT
ncbi:hypothetical protein L7F22_065722 [Adiantum nelumboides]|nr:hypothetical protein [Adiantum nelumboides]